MKSFLLFLALGFSVQAQAIAVDWDPASIFGGGERERACLLTENPSASKAELERKHASAVTAKNECRAAEAAAELAWETGNPAWAERALTHLRAIGDNSTAMIFGLRFLRATGGTHEEVRFRVLEALRNRIVGLRPGNDGGFIDLALGLSGGDDVSSPWLSFHQFAVDFPESKRAAAARGWHAEILRRWFESEKATVAAYVDREKYHAAVSRLETGLAVPGLADAPIFREYFHLWQRMNIRLAEAVDEARDAEIHIWAKTPASQPADRAGLKKFLRANTCGAIAAWIEKNGAKNTGADLIVFRRRYCR